MDDLTIQDRFAKYGFSAEKSKMDFGRLKELIKNGEDITIEFKLKANHPEKIIREIVAFANTEGGRLIIGVDDNKVIKGLKFSEEEQFTLVRAIEKNCVPPINYTIKYVVLPDTKEVLIFEIPKSKSRPHFVQLDLNKSEKIAYVRVNDKSLQASKEVRKYMQGNASSKNVQFTFGEKETALMKDYSKIAKIPMWVASRTLVLLSLANILKLIPGEYTDTFIQNSNF
jgi:predicted HTH transcriptional regulator